MTLIAPGKLGLHIRLAQTLWESPLLSMLFERWHELELPDAWLGAGCIAQTVWNALAGKPPSDHLRDIDVVYFDARDLSADTEAAGERRLRDLFPGLSFPLDVKNQARVHLWYPESFGKRVAPYTGIADAVRSWPTTATSIAVRPRPLGAVLTRQMRELEVCAPFGLDDLFAGIVRPNKARVDEKVYAAKVNRWRSCWPGLHFEPWERD